MHHVQVHAPHSCYCCPGHANIMPPQASLCATQYRPTLLLCSDCCDTSRDEAAAEWPCRSMSTVAPCAAAATSQHSWHLYSSSATVAGSQCCRSISTLAMLPLLLQPCAARSRAAHLQLGGAHAASNESPTADHMQLLPFVVHAPERRLRSQVHTLLLMPPPLLLRPPHLSFLT
jgi:hypothetical protein